MFVKELFGLDTKIINVAKKKALLTSSENTGASTTSPEHSSPPHQDADSSSMIEDIEIKSSCIAPEAGETEAAKEKDPSTLLNEPMVKEAIALFDPKKVRIKRNS
jgi:DNA polymerase-3 subunit gamma/tau